MNKAMWALRIGVAGEFLGHGVLALQGKADWIGWFAKFGVSNPETAGTLLMLVGLLDVCVALTVLIKPVKPVILWDFVERFANWGAPLALYFLMKKD
jgi:hypothetical protein